MSESKNRSPSYDLNDTTDFLNQSTSGLMPKSTFWNRPRRDSINSLNNSRHTHRNSTDMEDTIDNESSN